VLKVNTEFDGHPRWQGARLFTGGALPYAEGTFDLVFCVEVIEHVLPQHMDGMLRDLRRLLRPGTGRLLVTTPNDERMERNMVCCPECGAVFHKVQHVAHYDQRSLPALLESHGFATEACLPTDFGRLQLPGAEQLPLRQLVGAGPHLFWYGGVK